MGDQVAREGADLARAEAVVARWRRLAEDGDGLVRMAEGVSDAQIDTWPAHVPEHVRVLARAAAWYFVADFEGFGFLEPDNFDGALEHLLGPRQTWWALHADGAAHTWFADIDAAGGWGRVLNIDEDHDVEFLAPDVIAWLAYLADCAEAARVVARGGGAYRLPVRLLPSEERGAGATGTAAPPDAADVFADLMYHGGEFFEPWHGPDAVSLTAAQAARTGDPDLVRAAAGLAPDERVVDMRTMPLFSHLPYASRHGERIERLLGGAVLMIRHGSGG